MNPVRRSAIRKKGPDTKPRPSSSSGSFAVVTRTVDNTTTGPLRGADLASDRCARAPRLRAATADLRRVLGGVVPLSGRRWALITWCSRLEFSSNQRPQRNSTAPVFLRRQIHLRCSFSHLRLPSQVRIIDAALWPGMAPPDNKSHSGVHGRNSEVHDGATRNPCGQPCTNPPRPGVAHANRARSLRWLQCTVASTLKPWRFITPASPALGGFRDIYQVAGFESLGGSSWPSS